MQNSVSYLILAGGQGQRMNNKDKGLMLWQGKPMIEHLMARLNAPREKIIISANRNLDTYKQYANTVITDSIEGFQGPLVGILSAMQVCPTPFILCAPCDSPRPPDNLLTELWQCMQQQQKKAALCHDGDRLQPLFSLLSCHYQLPLKDFLQQGGRKVHDFMQRVDPAICDFSAQKEHFENFNQPADMKP